MKTLLLVTLALSLSAAPLVRADDKERKNSRQADSPPARSQPAGQAPTAARSRQARQVPNTARPQQARQVPNATRPQQSRQTPTAARQPVRQPVPQQVQRRTAPTQRNLSSAPRSTAPSQRQAVRSEAELDGRNRNRVQPTDDAVTPNRRDREDTQVTRTQGNRGNRNVNRGGNRNYDRDSFHTARTHVVRTPRNRNWWHSHYNTTFILFGGGYYYWWNNYWYPAYGYSPYYNTYLYNEPVYGYDNLAPGQVIENVQLALYDLGYYNGAIDGLLGPQTRAALGAYQQDHGLIVTEAVDEPTLVTLGLA